MFSKNNGFSDSILDVAKSIMLGEKCDDKDSKDEPDGKPQKKKSKIDTSPTMKTDDGTSEIQESTLFEMAMNLDKVPPYWKRHVLMEDDQHGYYLMYRNPESKKDEPKDIQMYESFYLVQIYFLETYMNKQMMLPASIAKSLITGLQKIK